MNFKNYAMTEELHDKILLSLQLRKQLKWCEEEIKKDLLEPMMLDNVKNIESEEYSLTLATRKNYIVVGDVPKEFTKTVLDSTKVSTHVKLYNELPVGIKETEKPYLVWKDKKRKEVDNG
jgi:hypothetical protein